MTLTLAVIVVSKLVGYCLYGNNLVDSINPQDDLMSFLWLCFLCLGTTSDLYVLGFGLVGKL
jgi:hypothetical protein